MSDTHKVHAQGFHPKPPANLWKRRGPQPAVHHVATPDRERGEIDLRKLAAAALSEADRAERRGRPVIAPNDGTTIRSVKLRLLVAEAKRELGTLRDRGRLRQAMEAHKAHGDTPG